MSKKFTTVNLNKLFEEIDNELTINQLKVFDEQIDETVNSVIREAVKHFQKRFRRNDDIFNEDERYLYSKKEVVMFYKLNKNPKVKTRVEWDEKFPNRIFCYVLYR